MSPGPTPPGVVAVFTDVDGRVIVSVSDFDEGRYGGFTLQQAQRIRVEGALGWAVVKAYCSDRVSSVLETHDVERIMRRMRDKGGAKITYIPVGHPEDTER